MVQCDDCNKWYHFECVGVDETIENYPWSCQNCQTKRGQAEDDLAQQDHEKGSVDVHTCGHGELEHPIIEIHETESEAARIEKEILELQKKLVDVYQAPSKSTIPVLQDSSINCNKKSLSNSELSKSSMSRKSSQKRKQIKLAQLDEEMKLQMKLQMEFLKRKHDLEDEFADLSTDVMDEEVANTSNHRLECWVNEQSQANYATNINPELQMRDTIPALSPSIANTARRHKSVSWLKPQEQDKFFEAKTKTAAENSAFDESITMKQIAMRQILSKDMPKFWGSLEEWPMFISWFMRSTEECRFSDDENLGRLQRCLQGQALNLVRGYMFYPGSLQQVLNTLRNRYGRPEQILHVLTEQLRSHANVSQERLETILDFSMAVQHVVATMHVSGLSDYINNPMLLQDLVDKMSGTLKLDWANYKSNYHKPDLSNFADWLSLLADKVGSVLTPRIPPKRDEKTDKSYRQSDGRKQYVHAAHDVKLEERASSNKLCDVNQSRNTNNCAVCLIGAHHLSECKPFLSLPKAKRREAVQSHRFCRKCLGHHHFMRCKVFKNCGVDGCIFKHHPLLHDPNLHSVTTTSNPTREITNLVGLHGITTTQMLFRIVPVKLYGPRVVFETYAFLDEGSTATLLDDEVAQILELSGPTVPLHLKWTGDQTRLEETSRRVSLGVSGNVAGNKRYDISDVRTVKSLDLPLQSLKYDALTSPYNHLRGLPVIEYRNAKPRLLIGLQHYGLGIPLKIREGKLGDPIATKTKLGWIIFGTHQNGQLSDTEDQYHFHICSCTTDEDLHNQVQEFFSTENFGVKKLEVVLESRDDQRAREILQSTTKNLGDRYVTGLLWRHNNVKFPDSFHMAKRRLVCLEEKMKKDSAFAKNLRQRFKEYVEKGYARKLNAEEVAQVTPKTWYLPVFSVTNPNKPGKFRIFWDAAATVNGTSLNSELLKGPDLLCSLPDILFRFRERKFAIAGDIREMYHQVRICEDDQQAQRFLWRDGDSTRKVQVYVMCVMTFGASCSPSVAHYVKNTNALRFIDSHPRAVLAICENHYVDDWLDSFATEGEAIIVGKDVINIHAAGGFEIRSFISNSDQVLAALGAKPNDANSKNLNLASESNGAKVLGMWWSTNDDTFYYVLNFSRVSPEILDGRRYPTKREVLRTLMMVFDPIGLISCFVVYVKILLQEIWRSPVEWDQPITYEQNVKWLAWTKTLPMLRDIRIPRCYLADAYDNLQLHVFVDASINAYAAAAYYRFEGCFGVKCSLISAKTKVAPQKPMSIPRLELQAAVLGSRLGNSVAIAHTLCPTQRFFWSDSVDVLSWLRSDHRRYRQFVAHRVGEILESTKLQEWRWVPTRSNVADEATKWKEQPTLNSKCRWFVGPEFLYLSEQEWPVERNKNATFETQEEHVTSASHFELPRSSLTPKYSNFSKWYRLRRSQAWALRWFWSKKNNTVNVFCGELELDEILQAEREIFRDVQTKCFGNEVSSLKNNPDKPISKSSSIYKLTPFLDEFDVLRVRGRATEVIGATYDALNPIILPRHHAVTNLILNYYHEKYLHKNHETVIIEVRQRFAVTRLRRCIQLIKFNCQTCKNEKTKPSPPRMAEHPQARVATYSAPFSFVGLDYFGPLEVVVGRRVEKRWVALFTCLTIRAVHLEIVHSLDKRSCWMAIRNFIARRGTPIEIRSDNGTNFVGVANELWEMYKQMAPDDYRREFGQIRWLFNPPASPHMGGCWERLVKSIKNALIKSMTTRRPNDETLRCYLMEAEGIVNSRPLTHVSIETEDDEAITPNHLLLGSSSGVKPFIEYSDESKFVRTSYELSQKMADCFWRRWIKEYLPTLTRTTKWFAKVKPIQIGNVVIIMDAKQRDSRRKGKVIDVIKGTGSDQVRQVVIRTPRGTYTRSASTVAVLDVIK